MPDVAKYAVPIMGAAVGCCGWASRNSVVPYWDATKGFVSGIYSEYPRLAMTSIFSAGAASQYFYPSIVGKWRGHFGRRESLLASADRRVEISDPATKANRIHGYIEMRFKDGTYMGSGTLVGNRYVVTAGHNLKDEKGEMALEARFYPGRAGPKKIEFTGSDGSKKLSSISTEYTVHPYYTGSNREYDIGVVKLPDTVGTAIGYAGYGAADSASALIQSHVAVTGYPGEKKMHMFSMQGPVVSADERRLSYDIDTSPGQSGSGVHVIDSVGGKDIPRVLAVHTHGVSSACLGRKNPYNSGTYIYGDVLDYVESLVQKG